MDELERALRDLRVHVPEAPDLTARVHAQLIKPKKHTARNLIIALLTALAVATAVSPAMRAGVVKILEFAGVEFRSQAPPSTAPPLTETEIALDQAPFPVHVPAKLGPPDKVTVHEGRFVTLHYKDMRLDQFDGTVESALGKIVNEADVERVDGMVWIPRPHYVYYIDKRGEWHYEEPRGSGKTLIWQRGDVTLRLQGDVTKEQALEISAS